MYDREHKFLDLADLYAKQFSGCSKVAVGSLIESKYGEVIALGANRTHPDLCKFRGCLRVEKYGNDSKAHRNPGDCRAVHSEIDAITAAASVGVSTMGGSIYVTRYPCENCARAIVSANIKTVYYGGSTRISPETAKIFECSGVEYYYIEQWKEDNTDR